MWDGVLRVILLLRHDKVSEQPLCGPAVGWYAEMVGCTAVSERIPVLWTTTGLRPPPATAHSRPTLSLPPVYPGQVATIEFSESG